jgi:hypothetical protein
LAAHPGRTPRPLAGRKERYASCVAQTGLRGLIEMKAFRSNQALTIELFSISLLIAFKGIDQTWL